MEMELSQKEKLFKTMDRIEELKTTLSMVGLNNDEVLELENLEVRKMQQWSDWKDPQD